MRMFEPGQKVNRICDKCGKARLEFSFYADGEYFFICPKCNKVFIFKERVF